MPRDEKDIIMKALTGALSGDALSVIGVSGVSAVRPLPTELDTVKQQMDMLWQMKDGRLFHLEFQTNRETTLHRFLMYDARLAFQYRAQIRTVVLYHGDVVEATEELNIGTAHYRVENVYLGKFDGDAALDTVQRHLHADEWTPEDRWRLALALNMQFPKRTREAAFEMVLNLMQMIPDVRERDFVAAGILGLTERALTESERIRIKKELIQVSLIAKEIHEEGREEGREQGSYAKAIEVAKKLLAEGMVATKVAEVTGLQIEEIEKLGKQLQ